MVATADRQPSNASAAAGGSADDAGGDDAPHVEPLSSAHVSGALALLARFWRGDADACAAERACLARADGNLAFSVAHVLMGVVHALFTLDASHIDDAATRVGRLEKLATACAHGPGLASAAAKRDAITVVSQACAAAAPTCMDHHPRAHSRTHS